MPASGIQILHTTLAALPGCILAPQQAAAAAGHRSQHGAQSRGVPAPSRHKLQSPSNLHPAPKPLKQEREAATPVHHHGQLSPGTSTSVGGCVCSTNGPVPTHNKDISLFTVLEVSFNQSFSPCQETLFLACCLPKALAALCLLLCTHLLIIFTSCFIHHHLQIAKLLTNKSLPTLLILISQLGSGPIRPRYPTPFPGDTNTGRYLQERRAAGMAISFREIKDYSQIKQGGHQ